MGSLRRDVAAAGGLSRVLLLVWVALLLSPASSSASVAASQWRSPSSSPAGVHSSAALLRARAMASGAVEWSVERPEGARSFWVRLPAAYSSSSPSSPSSPSSSNVSFPLLMAFHGLGDTCENFGVATGFSAYADDPSHSFIYVYPCGSQGPLGGGWNAGTCCTRPSKVDDVAFSLAILDELLAKGVRVEQSKVWGVGFSNGAMMVETLGCTAAPHFAAIASVSGDTVTLPGNAKGLQACDAAFASAPPQSGLRVLKVHGTADPLVPWKGDPLLGFVAPLQDSARWAQRVGCLPSVNHTTFHRGHYYNLLFDACNHSTALTELIVNEGGSHEWPQDADFDTTHSIVQFFFNLSLAPANASTHQRASPTLLHPAPHRFNRRSQALPRARAAWMDNGEEGLGAIGG